MTAAPASRPAGRPVIGVTAYEEEAGWNQWEAVEAALVPARYVRSVEHAGGIPVLIPVQDLTPEDAHHLLSRLDGVILTGGPDVEPRRYGADPHPKTGTPRSARDATESAICAASTGSALPILAICRGLQILNVVRGGTLHQHLPDLVEHDEHAPYPRGYGDHKVSVEPGSLIAGIVGWDSAPVPTHHHQAIDHLGKQLTATAWADDGTIEAVEDPSLPFLVGVQWHPEVGEDPGLFVGLVAAAAAFSAARA
jgi:putative glutamine amidotransferase